MAKRQARTAASKPVEAPATTLTDAPVTDLVTEAPAEPEQPAPAIPAPEIEEPPPVEMVAVEPEPEPDHPVSVKAGTPELDVFIAEHERAAQAIGQVVTAISYPDATPRLHVGVYSGFPIAAGDLQATYSDGSTH